MRRSLALAYSVLLLAGCAYDAPAGVTYPGTTATISVTPASSAPLLSAGDTETVSAVVMDATHHVVPSPSISWSSSAPGVATLTASGTKAMVTAVNDGTAIITATSGSASATVTITVRRVASTLTVTSGSLVLAPGETTPLTVSGRDARGHEMAGLTGFTYTTNSPGKVNVSPSGVVTAILPGDPIIVVASLIQNGFTVSGTTTISVASPLTFDYASHLLGESERPAPVITNGEGLAYFRLSGNRLQYQLTWTGLSGPALAIRIHGPAADNQTSDVLVQLTPVNQGATWGALNGNITAADIRPLGGQPPISLDSLIALMHNNTAYVNVQTTANATGEIRGQVVGPLR